jgi:hypothetical protein
LGIMLAVVVFIIDRRRERAERELETFRDVSGKYFEYLRLLVEHMDVSSTETLWSQRVDPRGSVKQNLIVQIAVNMIETAYFMYRDHRSSFRRAQWDGWYAYLKDWCGHPAFLAAWPELVEQYDINFQEVVKTAFSEVQGEAALSEGVSHRIE